jgi:hypothetical protein
MSTGNTHLNSAPGWVSKTRIRNRQLHGLMALINITVHGYFTFRALTGKRAVSLPGGCSLGDTLTCLQQDFGGRFEQEAFNLAGVLLYHVDVMLSQTALCWSMISGANQDQ